MNRFLSFFLFCFSLQLVAADHRVILDEIRFVGQKTIPTEILSSELGLKLEQPYAEAQLRQAAYRLERLPFVLEAGIQLRKGKTRGRYELVVKITEMRRRFWMLLGEPFIYTDQDYFQEDGGTGSDLQVNPIAPLFGYRMQVGRKGVFQYLSPLFFFYSHYDLFGTGGVVTLGAPMPVEFQNAAYAANDRLTTVTPDLAVASTWLDLRFPLVGNHWLRAGHRFYLGTLDEWQPAGEEPRDSEDFRTEFQELQIFWTYNSTDHSLFTTSGYQAEAGLRIRHLNLEWDGEEGLPPFPDSEEEATGLFFQGRRYWDLRRGRTVALGLAANGQNHEHRESGQDADFETGVFKVDALFAKNFGQQKIWGKTRDIRLEATAAWSARHSTQNDTSDLGNKDHWQAGLSLVSQDDLFHIRFSVLAQNTNEVWWP